MSASATPRTAADQLVRDAVQEHMGCACSGLWPHLKERGFRLAIEAQAAPPDALREALALLDKVCLYAITPTFRCTQRALHGGNHVSDPGASLSEMWAALAAPAGELREDFDAMRIARGWPTPMHMHRVADALDQISPAKYGDVLRWFADRCDEWVWHIGDVAAAERLDAARAALAAYAAPDPLVTYTDPAGGPDWEPRRDEA